MIDVVLAVVRYTIGYMAGIVVLLASVVAVAPVAGRGLRRRLRRLPPG